MSESGDDKNNIFVFITYISSTPVINLAYLFQPNIEKVFPKPTHWESTLMIVNTSFKAVSIRTCNKRHCKLKFLQRNNKNIIITMHSDLVLHTMCAMSHGSEGGTNIFVKGG